MGKRVDIFGDGEYIVDEDNFPDEIVVKSGKWKKVNQIGKIPGYQLFEPSQWYIDNVIEPGQEQARKKNKEMERSQKIAEKMREMAIKELEKEGEL